MLGVAMTTQGPTPSRSLGRPSCLTCLNLKGLALCTGGGSNQMDGQHHSSLDDNGSDGGSNHMEGQCYSSLEINDQTLTQQVEMQLMRTRL